MNVRDLLQAREKNRINHGGEFTFSITYSLDAIKEIENMGEAFTSRYQYTVAPIPKVGKTICISLKDLNRR
jgi:hypothetical protein